MPDASALAPDVLAGRRRAVARALTAVENGLPGADALVDALYPHTGRAWRLGVTGPPGAGKSTLVDRLVGALRQRGETVAVVAVDPSSPFTGGALLGDRVRMDRHADDDGVFVRSLAARGALGGLSEAAEAACDVFDAAGFGVVVVETVGVGQGEIDVAEACDTTLVVLVPESGDAVQAMKAGLMEVADVFAASTKPTSRRRPTWRGPCARRSTCAPSPRRRSSGCRRSRMTASTRWRRRSTATAPGWTWASSTPTGSAAASAAWSRPPGAASSGPAAAPTRWRRPSASSTPASGRRTGWRPGCSAAGRRRAPRDADGRAGGWTVAAVRNAIFTAPHPHPP